MMRTFLPASPGPQMRRGSAFRHLNAMSMDLRQLPEPSPPPIQEPPEGPENPDIPVREPDPDEPFQMSGS